VSHFLLRLQHQHMLLNHEPNPALRLIPGPQKYYSPPPLKCATAVIADLLPSYYVDVWSNGASYNRVCGGKEAVARACNSNENCNAFTFGAEADCGYLKRKYHSDPSEPLLFKNEGRGWDVYVSELIIPKTRGGSLDCVALKKPAHPLLEEVCSIKQGLPQSSGSLYA